MYEDANGNGIRDKKDGLISKGKFSDGFRSRDLPFKKYGVITAKAFDADKFQSQSLEMHGHQHEEPVLHLNRAHEPARFKWSTGSS